MEILHCFADTGVECEALAAYGTTTRVGLNPTDSPYTDHVIQADARTLELDTTFDLGLFHPPCTRWSKAAGEPTPREEYPNLIPLAREFAEEYCDNWIIENVPNAPLNDAVVLNENMFGLPVYYERAFETNYRLTQPPRDKRLTDFVLQDHGRCEERYNKALWKSVKGYSGKYKIHDIKNNGVPRAYLNYLIRPLLQ